MSITVILCSVVIIAGGCGGSLPASVSGKVTLDGEPVTTGVVMFHPAESGTAGVGQIGPDGSYQLKTGQSDGVPAGKYVATVTSRGTPPSLEEAGQGEPLVPERYFNKATSGLEFVVESGDNEIDIRLTSD